MTDLDDKTRRHLHTVNPGDKESSVLPLKDALSKFRKLFRPNQGYTYEQIMRARNLYAQPAAHFLTPPSPMGVEAPTEGQLSGSSSFTGPSSGSPSTRSVADDVMQQLLGGPEATELAGRLMETVESSTVPGQVKQSGRGTEEVNLGFSRSHAGERTQQSLRHLSIRIMNCIEHLQGRLAEQSEPTPALPDDAAQENANENAQGYEKGNENEKQDELTDSSSRKKPQKREQEVQGAVLNNRLVFATNHNRSVELLMQFIESADRQGVRRDLGDVLNLQTIDRIPYENLHDGLGSDRERLYRSENARLKTHARLAEPDPDNRTVLALADHLGRNTPVVKVDLRTTSPDDLKALLTSTDGRGSVILLQNTEGDNPSLDRPIHAEQKILQLLHKADLRPSDVVDGPVTIRGKKRPCFSCWMALHTFGAVPLSYNDHPGRFWKEPTETIAKHLPHLFREIYPVNAGTPVLRDSIARKLADNMYATVPSTVRDSGGTPSDASTPRPPTTSGWETGSDSDSGSGDELTSPMAKITLRDPRRPEAVPSDASVHDAADGGRPALPRDLTPDQQNAFLRMMPEGDREIRAVRVENRKGNAGYGHVTVSHALGLVNSGQASQAAVARFLGVSEVAVGKYRKRVGDDEETPVPAPPTDGRSVRTVLVEAKDAFLRHLEDHPAPKKRRTGAPPSASEQGPRLPGPNSSAGDAFWTPDVRAAFLRAPEQGWKLKDLAAWLGVPEKTVSNWKKNLTETARP
ncbi:helix-turn-helix domain-containing protein [Streptomyces roseicoloratus]|uniref:Helix-turn-helix domain-containing protein n=1 Tax=Streptomyces roseicoloratus TaxID=2508722 RepID=A0ABY9RPE5_9ACTN|nr:helix-turn-helix domain-containing protein [Streptomyces roseicoloratus]WMX43820.1 helix-turn-helix domain-containing protein [Streptomyces roseicoloratus]